MTPSYSRFLILTVAIITVQLGVNFVGAQEQKPTVKRRGPLPANYGKLGVSDEQREKMYDIQEEYDAKIAPLRDQIKNLLKERDSALGDQLTPGQLLRLKELKAEARKRSQKPLTEQEPKPENDSVEPETTN